MSYFLAIDFLTEPEQSYLDNFGRNVQELLGGAHVYNGCVSPSGKPSLKIFLWKLRGANDLHFIEDGQFWSVLEGQVDPKQFLQRLSLREGKPCFQEPVWGRYSVLLGTKLSGLTYGWQTTPAMTSINYAKAEGFLVAANHPLLVELSDSVFDDQLAFPSYSEEGIAQYLALGYTIGTETVFSKASQVPARHVLVVSRQGDQKLERGSHGFNHALEEEHSIEDAGEALADTLNRAFERAIVNLNGPIDMRVSGGKDSRMMLGLARKHGVDVKATCVGSGKDLDSRLGKHLTTLAGYDFTCRQAPAFAPVSAWESTRQSLRATLGVPQSEAHMTPNRFTPPDYPGQTLMFGNWPPYHGVYHRKMHYTEQEVSLVMDSTISTLVAPEMSESLSRSFDKWLGTISSNNRIESLYEFGLVMRGSNWMKPSFTGYSSLYSCNFFMSDQELTSLADKMTMFEHVSYAPEFIALRLIWPEAAALPLANDVWRFEAHGPADRECLDPSGYSARNPKAEDFGQLFPSFAPSKEFDDEAIHVFSDKIISELRAYLRSSSTYRFKIERLLSKDFIDYIDGDKSKDTPQMRRFVWRVYSATIALTLEWFRK